MAGRLRQISCILHLGKPTFAIPNPHTEWWLHLEFTSLASGYIILYDAMFWETAAVKQSKTKKLPISSLTGVSKLWVFQSRFKPVWLQISKTHLLFQKPVVVEAATMPLGPRPALLLALATASKSLDASWAPVERVQVEPPV